MAIKIISTWSLTPGQRQMIENAAGEMRLLDRQCRSPREVGELLREGCDILLTLLTPEQPERLASDLKWVQLLSAGADHVLNDAGTPRPFRITTASGIHATPIGEYILGSMLAWAHRMHTSIRAQARHEWLKTGYFMARVEELRGKTLGIIGYGSIGRETARLAQAFGMTVLALKRDPALRADPGWTPAGCGDAEGRIPSRFFGPAERAAMLAESDFIAVTLPLTEHTRGFIGAAEFAAMKSGTYLVNIGRGEVIDERALVEALRQKRIGGAGLDVFEREPLPAESPLWDFEEVILTPHMAGANRGYTDKACELFAENIRRFRAGRPLLNLVDPTLGY